MASIYSVRFGEGVQAGSAVIAVFEVPAGSVAVLRSVQLFCYSGDTANCSVILPSGVVIVRADIAAAPGILNWDGRAVFNAGESIEVDVGSGDWTYFLSGYLLSS